MNNIQHTCGKYLMIVLLVVTPSCNKYTDSVNINQQENVDVSRCLTCNEFDHSVSTNLDIVIASCKKGEYQLGIKLLEKLQEPHDGEMRAKFLLWKGNCLMGIQEYDNALECFIGSHNASLQYQPLLNAAVCCALEQADYDNAMVLLNGAIKTKSYEKYAHLFLAVRALTHLLQGNFEDAHLDIQNALKTENCCFVTYYQAIILCQEGKCNEAEKILIANIQKHKPNVWHEEWSCNCVAKQYDALARINFYLCRNEEAKAYLDKLIAIDPKNGVGYWARARFYFDKKAFDKSISDLDEVIDLSSGLKEEAEALKEEVIKTRSRSRFLD